MPNKYNTNLDNLVFKNPGCVIVDAPVLVARFCFNLRRNRSYEFST